jgi:hypothetical protein
VRLAFAKVTAAEACEMGRGKGKIMGRAGTTGRMV